MAWPNARLQTNGVAQRTLASEWRGPTQRLQTRDKWREEVAPPTRRPPPVAQAPPVRNLANTGANQRLATDLAARAVLRPTGAVLWPNSTWSSSPPTGRSWATRGRSS